MRRWQLSLASGVMPHLCLSFQENWIWLECIYYVLKQHLFYFKIKWRSVNMTAWRRDSLPILAHSKQIRHLCISHHGGACVGIRQLSPPAGQPGLLVGLPCKHTHRLSLSQSRHWWIRNNINSLNKLPPVLTFSFRDWLFSELGNRTDQSTSEWQKPLLRVVLCAESRCRQSW